MSDKLDVGLQPRMQVSDYAITKYARPDETWDQARMRLDGELSARYTELQGCTKCVEEAVTLSEAEENHCWNDCFDPDSRLRFIAEDPRLHKIVMEHLQKTQEVLALVGQNAVARQVEAIRTPEHYRPLDEMNEITDILHAVEVFGYIRALRDLGLTTDIYGRELDGYRMEAANKLAELHDGLVLSTSMCNVTPFRGGWGWGRRPDIKAPDEPIETDVGNRPELARSLTEALLSGDPEATQLLIREAIEAEEEGWRRVAKATGTPVDILEKSFRAGSHPSAYLVSVVLKALGLQLSVKELD